MKKLKITYNPDTDRYELGETELHCGNVLEVFLNGKWVSTRIEYRDDWYLVDLTGVKLEGLTARM